MPVVSTFIRTRFIYDPPEREILRIDLYGPHLRLRVPLDSSFPAEAKVLSNKGDSEGVLMVTYNDVRVRLDNDLKALRASFFDLYRSNPLGARLRASEFPTLTPEEQQAALAPIATRGAAIFHRLFLMKPHKCSSASADVKLIPQAVQSALSRTQHIVVSYVGKPPHPILPWGLLYSDPKFSARDRSQLEPKKFWAFLHDVRHEFDWVSDNRWLTPEPTIVEATCPVATQGVTVRQNQFANAKTVLVPDKDRLGKTLKAFQADGLYFLGHANHEEPPDPITSYLELNSERLTVDELRRTYRAPNFRRKLVLLFLNGCKTAPLESWHEDTMVGHLFKEGDFRACCVATSAEVPSRFAVEFAGEFWTRFLSKRLSLGSALRGARLQLLEKGNPLGMLYELFGRHDVSLSPPPLPGGLHHAPLRGN